MNGPRTLMGLVAAVMLSAACDSLRGAAELHADLSAVRRAVQPLAGQSHVEVRIANGPALSVAIVNHPIQLRPAAEKHAKARDVARAAYDAYARRSTLGGVRVALAARGGFPLFTIGASEEYWFDRSVLAHPPASAASTR